MSSPSKDAGSHRPARGRPFYETRRQKTKRKMEKRRSRGLPTRDPKEGLGPTLVTRLTTRLKLRKKQELLDSISDEFAKDSAIHLYSVHLLHTKCSTLPHKEFASWPRPLSEVPIPKLTLKYTGETELTANNNAVEQLNRLARPSLAKPPWVIQKLFERPEPSTYRDVNKRAVPPAYWTYKEDKLTNSAEELSSVLDAIFQRKIYQRIHDFKKQEEKDTKKKSHIRPVVDPPIQLPEMIKARIFKKVNDLMDKMIVEQSQTTYPYISRINKYGNWLSIASKIDNSATVDICDKLFNRINYADHSSNDWGQFSVESELVSGAEELPDLINPDEKGLVEDKDGALYVVGSNDEPKLLKSKRMLFHLNGKAMVVMAPQQASHRAEMRIVESLRKKNLMKSIDETRQRLLSAREHADDKVKKYLPQYEDAMVKHSVLKLPDWNSEL